MLYYQLSKQPSWFLCRNISKIYRSMSNYHDPFNSGIPNLHFNKSTHSTSTYSASRVLLKALKYTPTLIPINHKTILWEFINSWCVSPIKQFFVLTTRFSGHKNGLIIKLIIYCYTFFSLDSIFFEWSNCYAFLGGQENKFHKFI